MSRSNTQSSERIVSLAPSVTSILVALGARRQLVGVTRWCAAVARVDGLPRVGDCWSLDVKQVERLRPTLLIGSVPYKPETVAKLIELPAPFVATNPRSLADIYADIRLLGRLVGRAAAAGRLIGRMKQELRRIAAKAIGAKPRLRVYCEAWPKPRIASPPWVRELVEIAGGRMVVPAGARVTDEDVARARPDVIVLAWTATGARARASVALKNPAWHEVPAVRYGRVFVVRDEWLNTPGPPVVLGAHVLARIFRSGRGAASQGKPDGN